MRLELRRLEEMDVVGRDQRQVQAQRHLDQGRLDLVLIDLPMPHQLDVEPAREDLQQALEQALGEAAVAVQQRPAGQALRTAGERDQPLAEAREVIQLQLGRAAHVAPEIGAAQQLQEVLIAGLALDQHRQQGRRRRPAIAARRIVALHRQEAADQRLHAGLGGVLARRQGVEQVRPVGDADRRHEVGAAALEQALEADGALEQRVAGADAQVDERSVRHGIPGRGLAAN